MFCRKCGNEIPEDSLFCPKCGAAANADANNSGATNPSYPQSNAQNNIPGRSNDPAGTSLICPNCGKQLLATWTKCMYCGAFNPFNSDVPPTNTTIITPPPQVIVKHVDHTQEDLKRKNEEEEEKAHAALAIFLVIAGFFLLLFLIDSCTDCLGCV